MKAKATHSRCLLVTLYTLENMVVSSAPWALTENHTTSMLNGSSRGRGLVGLCRCKRAEGMAATSLSNSDCSEEGGDVGVGCAATSLSNKDCSEEGGDVGVGCSGGE